MTNPDQHALPREPSAWTCYHCGETFTDPNCAREHFGIGEYQDPGCLERVPNGERTLLAKLREQEERLNRYRAEDSDTDRAMYAMKADHAQALIREEEKGYAKGVADARKEQEPSAEVTK